jgi:hypothetical protein
VPATALSTKPSPQPAPPPAHRAEEPFGNLSLDEPKPPAPVPPPATPPGGTVLRCADCRVGIGPRGDGTLPEVCPRCGGPIVTVAVPPRPAPAPVPRRHPDLSGPPCPGPMPLVDSQGRRLTYTATMKVRCWKQHTCFACGCVYRYKFERSGKGQNNFAEVARDNAEQQVFRALEQEVETRPCPTCGLVQPDMAAQGKMTWHSYAVLGMVLAVPLVLLPVFVIAVPPHVPCMIGAVAAGLAAVVHLLAALYDPNRDRARNRETVKKELDRHRLAVVQRGSGDDLFHPPGNLTWGHALALLAVMAAVPLLLAAFFVRETTDLPLNENLRPVVVGPGDEVTLDFPPDDDVRSIYGLWRAKATVKVANAAETGASQELPAVSSDRTWGEWMIVRERDMNRRQGLYARVQLPDDDSLGGKSLRLVVSLDVVYPQRGYGTALQIQGRRKVSREFTVRVAAAEDRDAYHTAWWAGAGLGLALALGGGVVLVWLAVRLRGRAQPTQLVPIRLDPAGREADHTPIA